MVRRHRRRGDKPLSFGLPEHEGAQHVACDVDGITEDSRYRVLYSAAPGGADHDYHPASAPDDGKMNCHGL